MVHGTGRDLKPPLALQELVCSELLVSLKGEMATIPEAQIFGLILHDLRDNLTFADVNFPYNGSSNGFGKVCSNLKVLKQVFLVKVLYKKQSKVKQLLPFI